LRRQTAHFRSFLSPAIEAARVAKPQLLKGFSRLQALLKVGTNNSGYYRCPPGRHARLNKEKRGSATHYALLPAIRNQKRILQIKFLNQPTEAL
jgi:hypothetical protein